MASQTERERTIAGKVTLLPPADKLDPSAALFLRNFRSDVQNKLVCRGGSVAEFKNIGTGRFHTISHGSGFIYNGVGTGLWYGRNASNFVTDGFDGNPISIVSYLGQSYAMNRGKQVRLNVDQAFNWGMTAPTAAPVATGGGQLISVIEPFDGSSGLNTITVAAQGLTPMAPNNMAMMNDAPTASDANPAYVIPGFDATVVAPGSVQSLALAVQQACTFTDTLSSGSGPAFDSTFSGLAQDTDVFQFWVAVSDPTQVTSFSISMMDNAGGFVEVNFQPNPGYGGTFFPPSKFLSQTPGQWAQISIQRQVNLDTYAALVASVQANPPGPTSVSDVESQYSAAVTSPAFAYVGTGSPQTNLPVPPVSPSQLPFNWAAITQVAISFVLAGECQVNLDDLQVLGTVGANIEGSGQYYVSFFNALLQDSNPSPPSNSIIFGNETPELNNIPTSTDPQVIGRYIWRIGFGSSQALQVGIIYDNVGTGPWFDYETTVQAQDNAGIVTMPINRDPAPPARIAVGPFFGKILAFSTSDHPSRMFWTNAGQPWFFPGSNDDGVGNWEDVGGDDDEILAVTMHPTVVVIYKERSIWLLPGDPATNDAVQTNSNVGVAGQNLATSAGQMDFFVAPEGIYRFNLDFEDKISTDVDPIFKGDFVLLGLISSGANILPPANPDLIGSGCICLAGQDRLRFSYASYSSSVNDTTIVFHVPSGRWLFETYDNLPTQAPTAMTYGGSNPDGLVRTLMGGFTEPGGGSCYRLEQINVTTDDGNPILCEWITPRYDQGLSDILKWFSDLQIDCGPGLTFSHGLTFHVELSVTVNQNGGQALIDLGDFTTLEIRGVYNFPPLQGFAGIPTGGQTEYGIRGKDWQLRITCEVPFGGMEIYGLYMRWYPEEREASTYDSGFTNFGLPERCKEVDYFELYCTSNGGTAQLQISSDLPGSTLTYRAGWPRQQLPFGRGNVRFRLPPGSEPLDGRNYRFQVINQGTALMQIHQARLRMRPIGEYIDGTLNPPEYYESPEFSVQPGRVGQLKDFLLDYDVSAAGGQFVIYSDLPGSNGLQIVRNIPIPYQGGTRGIYVFPLEDNADQLPNGQLFKVRLYPPAGGILRLHGRAQFRARLLTAYFNGANGEVWETQPEAIFGGTALIREGSVIIQTTGPMLFEVMTELPNGTLQTVGSYTVNSSFTATAQRLPIYGRFPGNSKGHMVKCRISGPYIAQVYEVRLYGRRLWTDDPLWAWVDVNLEGQPGATDGGGEASGGGFSPIDMPVRETPPQFSWIDMQPDPA